MARYPGTLESANTNEFGIVFADHIQGHRTVANLDALYKLSDAILSKSKNNTGSDAIGQEWYVISEKSLYRLDNWTNRKQASGWRKLQNVDAEFDSLQTHGADKIKNFTTTASDVTLNYNTWRSSKTSEDGTAVIPAASSSKAGAMTAADKVKLDTTIPNYTVNTHKISSNPVLNSGDIKMDDYVLAEGTSEEELTIKTTDTVGVALGKLQKQSLDNEEVVSKAITVLRDSLGFDEHLSYNPSDEYLSSIFDVTTSIDTVAQKLREETNRATAKEEQLESTINSNKTTIDNYTVNSIKISTNPVITGANANVTGYSKPSSTSAITATDSINAALGKLEKKADDHIANKSNPHGVTKAQVGLGNCDNTSDLNKPISNATQTALNSKVQTVEVTGTGNAITAASISGTKLTLTKGATYNNQTYTAGTNLSLSGNTFSLNSTISLTRVNASSGFFQTSDKRLKSEIKPLDHSLEDICSIPTDSFILNGKNDFGTIAQEVEDKFPELVSEARLKESDVDEPSKFDKVDINGESYVLVKEVDYSKLSILAIEGIKLLKKELEELKRQLSK